MKIYQKYIFWQILIYTLLCLGVFVFILVAGKVIRDGAELLAVGRVSIFMFLELFSFLILYVATYALPLSLLTAILLVLGRLSSQQEITALKASGISLINISIPILLIAIIGTCANLVINTYLAPLSKKNYKYRLAHAVAEHPFGFIQEKTFIKDFPGFTLYLEKKDKNQMHNFWIWEHSHNETVGLLKAENGEFKYNKNNGTLQLTLKNGTAEKRSDNNDQILPYIAVFDSLTLKLPLQLDEKNEENISNTQLLTIFQLSKLAENYKQQNNYLMEIKVRTEMQKDLATAFSVFSLAILAIPLGIKVSRKETYVNLVLATILAGSYYSLLLITTWFSGSPQCRPDLLIWIPNILFQVLGIFWLWKANKQ